MALHQPPHFFPSFPVCLLLLFTPFLPQLPLLSFAHPFPVLCGEHVFDYPFGLKNSGHGDLSLQIDCDYGHTLPKPVIHISGKKYYVLFPKVYDHNFTMGGSMTIIDKKLTDKCDPSFNNYTELRSSPQFQIADAHIDIGLGGHCKREWTDLPNRTAGLICNPDWHYNLTVVVSWAKICRAQVVLPVNNSGGPVDERQIRYSGFPIKWNVSNRCRDCMSSGGHCGYDTSPMKFHCKCWHLQYPHICPSGQRLNQGTRTGIAIGGSDFITLVALFLIIVYRKRSSYFKWIQTWDGAEPMNSGSVERVENFLQSYIHQMPTRYSFSQLKKITKNFADKLGEGGSGVVYKGNRSGKLLAVKILDQSRQSERQFMNEVATLGTIHHVHLVRLMGYCFEGFRSALLYEYMANGSLEKFLFAERGKEQMLNWDQLYSIALGAARGIAYLHEDCNRRIIHFDIKPHNILLDEDFTPKVADFGLAKVYAKIEDHVSMTGGRGTPGYAAPEVWSRNLGAVTDKSDVYSFGMLLLEIAGRKKNIELQASRSRQLFFQEWAFKLIEKGELEKRSISEKGSREEKEVGEEEEVRRMAKVGLWCIQYNSIERPSMNRVVEMLEGRGDDVSNPPLPFKSWQSPPREAAVSSSTEIYSSVL